MIQEGFDYRFDWGLEGLQALAPHAACVVIVDVLRFTTAVCCAVESGVTVLPYRWDDESAPSYAAAHHADLAGRREHGLLSLSPTDLLLAAPGTRLVLPSPNGSTLAFVANELGCPHVIAGCLRNASAVADAARRFAEARPIAVIAAGERWHEGPLRPAVEDLIGAGSILAALDPSAAVGNPCCSPEARAARAAFIDARPLLFDTLCASSSGRELLERGWADDIATAAAHDVSTAVPLLSDGEFRP